MSDNCNYCGTMVSGCIRKQYSQFDKLLDKYGKELLEQFKLKTGFSCDNFTLEKVVHRKFSSFSCLELITIACAFEYVGAYDQYEVVDFPLSFFRCGEFNIARQLRLFMLEALQYGTINNHLHAYKDKYTVYGYLFYFPDMQNQYTFRICEFDVNDSVILTAGEKEDLRMFVKKKLVKFRKLCTKVEINNLEIDPHLYSNNDKIYSMLINDGFVNTRHGMMWAKR